MVQDWSWQNRQIFLSENVVDLAVLAPEMEQEIVLLFELVVAERALHFIDEVVAGLLELLHEVSAEVLLQLVETDYSLLTHLTGQV